MIMARSLPYAYSVTVLSKSLGLEMREFRSLFSRTFVESSLESSREISRHLERYFAAFSGPQRNFALNSEMSPAGKRTFARQRTALY